MTEALLPAIAGSGGEAVRPPILSGAATWMLPPMPRLPYGFLCFGVARLLSALGAALLLGTEYLPAAALHWALPLVCVWCVAPVRTTNGGRPATAAVAAPAAAATVAGGGDDDGGDGSRSDDTDAPSFEESRQEGGGSYAPPGALAESKGSLAPDTGDRQRRRRRRGGRPAGAWLAFAYQPERRFRAATACAVLSVVLMVAVEASFVAWLLPTGEGRPSFPRRWTVAVALMCSMEITALALSPLLFCVACVATHRGPPPVCVATHRGPPPPTASGSSAERDNALGPQALGSQAREPPTQEMADLSGLAVRRDLSIQIAE